MKLTNKHKLVIVAVVVVAALLYVGYGSGVLGQAILWPD
jgi:hypothetical protein